MATIAGTVDSGYGPVADAFLANFTDGLEVGAACCVYRDGRIVVDIHAGVADQRAGHPWTPETIVPVYSMSKGLMSLLAYLASQRDLLNLDAPVGELWPEFARLGKEKLRIRDLFSHRAGLIAVDRALTLDDVAAWDPVVRALEDQQPLWEPGTAFSYHPLTFGWLAGEVLRRATGLRPGRLLAEWITDRVKADAWIGLPAEDDSRVGHLEPPPAPQDPATIARYQALNTPLMMRARTLGNVFPRGVIGGGQDLNSPAVRRVEVPAANAMTSAPHLARIYAAAVGEVAGGRLLTDESIRDALTVRSEGEQWPGVAGLRGMRFSTGFMLNRIPHRPLLSDASFGHDGAGGGLACADADAKIGFAYVNNRMLGFGDTRANRITAALRQCVG